MHQKSDFLSKIQLVRNFMDFAENLDDSQADVRTADDYWAFTQPFGMPGMNDECSRRLNERLYHLSSFIVISK